MKIVAWLLIAGGLFAALSGAWEFTNCCCLNRCVKQQDREFQNKIARQPELRAFIKQKTSSEVALDGEGIVQELLQDNAQVRNILGSLSILGLALTGVGVKLRKNGLG